jgi:hypothetical protein
LSNPYNGLLHFEGANDSINIFDEYKHNWSITSTAKISTAKYKFGSSSLYLDGIGTSYILTNDFTALGNKFTIEGWFYVSSFNDGNITIFKARIPSLSTSIYLTWDKDSTKLILRASSDGTNLDIANNSGSKTDWVTETWYKWVVDFDSSVYRVFVGTSGSLSLDISVTSSLIVYPFNEFDIGPVSFSSPTTQAYIDEVRITLWQNRYGGSASAETSAFLVDNFGGTGNSGYSGYSGISGYSGYSGYSGAGTSGYSGYSGTGTSGYSGYSGAGISGYSGYSGTGTSGYSGYSGAGTSGYSGISGYSGLLDNPMSTELNMGENAGFALDAALSATGIYCGIVEAGTAGATLVFGDICYLQTADSRWELAGADNAAVGHNFKLGMCVLAAASDGQPTKMLLYGKIRADAIFPTFTIGAPVYLSTTLGDVQVAAPTATTDIVRVVGYGNTADELFFNPSQGWIDLV